MVTPRTVPNTPNDSDNEDRLNTPFEFPQRRGSQDYTEVEINESAPLIPTERSTGWLWSLIGSSLYPQTAVSQGDNISQYGTIFTAVQHPETQVPEVESAEAPPSATWEKTKAVAAAMFVEFLVDGLTWGPAHDVFQAMYAKAFGEVADDAPDIEHFKEAIAIAPFLALTHHLANTVLRPYLVQWMGRQIKAVDSNKLLDDITQAEGESVEAFNARRAEAEETSKDIKALQDTLNKGRVLQDWSFTESPNYTKKVLKALNFETSLKTSIVAPGLGAAIYSLLVSTYKLNMTAGNQEAFFIEEAPPAKAEVEKTFKKISESAYKDKKSETMVDQVRNHLHQVFGVRLAKTASGTIKNALFTVIVGKMMDDNPSLGAYALASLFFQMGFTRVLELEDRRNRTSDQPKFTDTWKNARDVVTPLLDKCGYEVKEEDLKTPGDLKRVAEKLTTAEWRETDKGQAVIKVVNFLADTAETYHTTSEAFGKLLPTVAFDISDAARDIASGLLNEIWARMVEGEMRADLDAIITAADSRVSSRENSSRGSSQKGDFSPDNNSDQEDENSQDNQHTAQGDNDLTPSNIAESILTTTSVLSTVKSSPSDLIKKLQALKATQSDGNSTNKESAATPSSSGGEEIPRIPSTEDFQIPSYLGGENPQTLSVSPDGSRLFATTSQGLRFEVTQEDLDRSPKKGTLKALIDDVKNKRPVNGFKIPKLDSQKQSSGSVKKGGGRSRSGSVNKDTNK